MVNRREILGSIAAAGTAALWPPQSFALGDGAPSRTAQSAALHRAAHQLLETQLVFQDPLALQILGPEHRRLLWASLLYRQSARSRAMRAFIVMRSRYAEDELAAAFKDGTRQYVVLGAGLDTFAYRNPLGEQLKVYEVDHPSTQSWKRKQLHEQGIDVPSALSFVAVDFEKDSLGACLDRAGFDRNAPAFISWLGVTMYLTREAVLETLGFVGRSCFRGSQIVFDFAPPDELLSETERSRRNHMAAIVSRFGEPWISWFDAGTLASDLLGIGFTQASSLSASDANARYFNGRVDGIRVVGSGRIMKASI